MGAYDTIDVAIAGLKHGLKSEVESWVVGEANGIEFGRPVFGYDGDDKTIYKFHNDRAKLVFSADLITLNSTVVTIQGTALDAVVFDTNHLTTMNLIIAALVAAGYSAELDTTDTTNRTIFVVTKGATIAASAAVTGGESQATVAVTYDYSNELTFVGVTLFTQKEYAENAMYKYQECANVIVDGGVYGSAGEAVESNTPAYVLTSGTYIGQFGDSGFTTSARFRGDISAAGIVRMTVAGQSD